VIKKRYFELLKQYHPDINKTTEAEIKTKELNEAYCYLRNYYKNKNKNGVQYNE
jgi:DnaJ-class molecular chaperone